MRIIDIAAAEIALRQEFFNDAKRQKRVEKEAKEAQGKELKWTKEIEVLEQQLQREVDATTGWERQLQKRAADALKRNLNLRKLYMDTGVGLGRWQAMSTASGSNDKRNRDGNAHESGQAAKNAKRKDEWCAECNAPRWQSNMYP